MDAQELNLKELVEALAGGPGDDSISKDLRALLEKGLATSSLPGTLKDVRAAQALQLAFEGMGGLPRLLLWADKYPASFYKLYARMVAATVTPVLPTPPQQQEQEWPSWLTQRRLAYQEGTQPDTDGMEDPDDHAS